jgi:hypothetical protein
MTSDFRSLPNICCWMVMADCGEMTGYNTSHYSSVHRQWRTFDTGWKKEKMHQGWMPWGSEKLSHEIQLCPSSVMQQVHLKLWWFLILLFKFLLSYYCCTILLWHSQKCLQYILVKFTPSSCFFVPHCHILRIVSTCLIFPFSNISIYFYSIHSPLPFPYILPSHAGTNPQTGPAYPSYLPFPKKRFLFV